MFDGRSTSPPYYLDTSVISGYVNEDMKPSDIHAFQKIVHMSQKGELILCTSTVAKEEIEKIPIQYQSSHLEMYETLQILQGSITTWLDDDPFSTCFGKIVEHDCSSWPSAPLYRE